MRTRLQRLRVTLLAAATVGAAVLFYSGSPAQADVTATSGSAFGAQVRLLGLDLINPTPTVVGGPGIGYFVPPATTVGLGLPFAQCPLLPASQPTNVNILNILDVCAITVSTFGTVGATPHLNAANSTATIAGVAVGSGPSGLLTLNAVNLQCKADGNNATASMSVANATLGNGQLLSGPVAPNTAITVPGLASVILNAQVKSSAVGSTPGNVNGLNGIVAEAARITLLDNTLIVLGHVECLAQGPDVNEVTTTTSTTTTLPPTTSTSTSTTTTTVPPGPTTTTTSTTVPPGATTTTSTTSTTVPPGATTTTSTTTTLPTTTGTNPTAIVSFCNGGSGNSGSFAGAACNTIINNNFPGQPGPPPAAPVVLATNVLARTGSTLGPVAMVAFALTVLGLMMFLGSKGLPDSTFRAFTSHPAFRPVFAVSESRLLPAGGSSRLDPAAMDALSQMQGTSPPPPAPEGGPSGGSQGQSPSSRRMSRKWFSKRPW